MALRTGQVLRNRYRIESVLGEGGMGTVYLAQDLRTDRPRAIKELYPDPLAGEAKLRAARLQFKREADALTKLDHPNIPRVSEYFSIDENDYLVMDYVAGQSLADILARRKRPTERLAYTWLQQILDALHYCHRRHVLHRDIKPDNIILTPEGRVMLVDFSLVKIYDPRNPRTATIVHGLGTPQYTPLEQYDASLGHTDPRSDIYALGATLYHLLTGHPPQPVSQRILNPATQPPIHELNRRISPWMTRFVGKAMAIHPGDRFESAREMRRALKRRLVVVKHEQRIAEVDPQPMRPSDQLPASAQPVQQGRSAPVVRYVRNYTPRVAPVLLPILKPVTVIVVLTVAVTLLFSTASTTVAAIALGPVVVGGLIFHRIRRLRDQGPPRF
jgi:serine/threonine-protein kinase